MIELLLFFSLQEDFLGLNSVITISQDRFFMCSHSGTIQFLGQVRYDYLRDQYIGRNSNFEACYDLHYSFNA